MKMKNKCDQFALWGCRMRTLSIFVSSDIQDKKMENCRAKNNLFNLNSV